MWTVRILIAAHDVFITTLVLELIDVRAAHDLNESVICAISQKLGNIDAFLVALDQSLELSGELFIEVNFAILAPHPFEWLVLLYELPVSVKHLSLSLDKRASIILVATIEDRRRLVVDACHLESLVDLLSQMLVRDVLWPFIRHCDGLVSARVCVIVD